MQYGWLAGWLALKPRVWTVQGRNRILRFDKNVHCIFSCFYQITICRSQILDLNEVGVFSSKIKTPSLTDAIATLDRSYFFDAGKNRLLWQSLLHLRDFQGSYELLLMLLLPSTAVNLGSDLKSPGDTAGFELARGLPQVLMPLPYSSHI